MPIYEFYSPATNKIYSFYSRILMQGNEVPQCPDGIQFEMVKIISGFSITGRNDNSESHETTDFSTDESDPFSRMSPDQSAQVMKEMERAMSGMDDENPDPRQMGSLMRRMCEVTGEKMDEVMEEVVRKLEEGTNPEELEEKMGEFAGDLDADHIDHENPQDQSKIKKMFRKSLVRDPELYEMKDFLK